MCQLVYRWDCSIKCNNWKYSWVESDLVVQLVLKGGWSMRCKQRRWQDYPGIVELHKNDLYISVWVPFRHNKHDPICLLVSDKEQLSLHASEFHAYKHVPICVSWVFGLVPSACWLHGHCNFNVWALRRRCNNWLLLSHKTDLVCHIYWGPRNYNEGGCTEVLWFSLNSSDVTVFAGACTERKMAHQTRPSREWLAPHLARAARFSVRTGFWEPAFCKWHGIRYLVNKSCLCSQQLPGYLRGSRLIWKKSLILEKYWLSASKVSF